MKLCRAHGQHACACCFSISTALSRLTIRSDTKLAISLLQLESPSEIREACYVKPTCSAGSVATNSLWCWKPDVGRLLAKSVVAQRIIRRTRVRPFYIDRAQNQYWHQHWHRPVCPDDSPTTSTRILKCADSAMYNGERANGRNGYRVLPRGNVDSKHRDVARQIETALRDARSRTRTSHWPFKPIVDLSKSATLFVKAVKR